MIKCQCKIQRTRVGDMITEHNVIDARCHIHGVDRITDSDKLAYLGKKATYTRPSKDHTGDWCILIRTHPSTPDNFDRALEACIKEAKL